MKIGNNKFTPEHVTLFNDTWSGKKEWTKLEEKVPSMMNYNSVNEDGEINTSKYGVVVSPLVHFIIRTSPPLIPVLTIMYTIYLNQSL